MTPGQAAYNRYRVGTGGTREWEALHPIRRKKWEEIAAAAIDQHIIELDGDCTYSRWQELKQNVRPPADPQS